MLRLKEVASQSETFPKRALRKAKTSIEIGLSNCHAAGGKLEVFSLDRPPLLAVRRRVAGREPALQLFPLPFRAVLVGDFTYRNLQDKITCEFSIFK